MTHLQQRHYVLIMVSHSRVEHLLLISESSTPQPQNSAKELSSVGPHAPLGKYPSDNTAGRSNVEVKLSPYSFVGYRIVPVDVNDGIVFL